MLAVMREHGPCHEHRDGGVVEVTLPVGAADQTLAETPRGDG